MINYSRDKINELCKDALTAPEKFYTYDFIKSDEVIKDEIGTVYRTELIAEFIHKNIENFKKINTVSRKNYKMASHDGDNSKSKDPKISERKLAKILFAQSKDGINKYEYIGTIKDYETPLKATNADKGVGKIDLLAINDENRTVYILELKKDDSSETLLRCALEGYTYSCIVDREKLFESFDIPQNYDVIPATLIFKKGTPGEQKKEMDEGKRPYLKRLITEDLKVEIFYIELGNDGTYKVIV